jgi:hypothetical protein
MIVALPNSDWDGPFETGRRAHTALAGHGALERPLI